MLVADHAPYRPLLRTRRIIAAPLYVVAIALTLIGDLLGLLAAKIAGDD
jgi:hypothetical protein